MAGARRASIRSRRPRTSGAAQARPRRRRARARAPGPALGRDRGVPPGVVGRDAARPTCSASRSASSTAAWAWATSRPRSSSRSSPGPTCRARSSPSSPSTARPRRSSTSATTRCKERWLPLGATARRCSASASARPRPAPRSDHMRARAHPRRRRLPPQRLQELRRPVGHKAAACLVWCRFPGSEGTKGIGAVVVDLDRDGVTVAGTHVKMGLRGTSEAELAFDDVRDRARRRAPRRRPGEQRLVQDAIAHINHERCGNAAMCIGAAQGALEYAVRYMNERMVGGKPLAELQGLQWKIADMATQLEGARLLLQRARAPRRRRTARRRRSRPRWRRPPPTSPRSSCATRRSSCSAATATRREYPVERVVPRHPRAVHRRRHGRDPAQLHRHERAAGHGAERQRLAGSPLRLSAEPGSAPPTGTAAADVPPSPAARGTSRRSTRSLDDRAGSHPTPSTTRRRSARRRRCAPRACGRGDVVAWQAPNSPRSRCSTGVLAPRRDRRRRSTTRPAPAEVDAHARASRTATVVRRPPTTCRPLGRRRRAGARPAAPRPDGPRRRRSSPSGSSGEPKGVLHTHRGLAYKAQHDGRRARPRARRRRC